MRVRQKDENKAEQIYRSTMDLVLEKGLSGVTMCDISRSAGIATGTLYIYFRNKEELMNALFSHCRTESALYYLKDLDDANSFGDNFKSIFRNILNYRLLHFEKFIFLEQCYHSPFISIAVRKESLKALNPLFHLFEQGREQKLIKDLDNHLLLGFIIGCINEVVKKAHYAHTAIDDATLENLFLLCWDGVRRAG